MKLRILAAAPRTADQAQRLPTRAFPPLRDDEVHVWTGSLRRPLASLASLETVISAEEARRAGALRSAAERRRYLVSRGQLRLLLAWYLRTPPSRIRLCHGPHGKPTLIAPRRRPPLRFSVSHSEDRVVYALTRAAEVGTDVERVRQDLNWRGLAGRFFAPGEAVQLDRVGTVLGQARFYQLWTQKEALAKADGGSLFWWLGTDLSAACTLGWRLWSWWLPAGPVSVALIHRLSNS